jgi:hypothetical protein
LLAHNKQQLKRSRAELQKRADKWVTLKSHVTDNKRLAGYTDNTFAGCVKDVAAAPIGDGNNALNRKAFKLGGYVNVGLISRDDVMHGLLDATRTWESKASDTECRNTIESGLKAAAAKNNTPKIPADVMVDNDPTEAAGKTLEKHSTADEFEDDFEENPDPVLSAKLLTRSDLHNLPDPEPLIDNVLDQGTTALLYGSWGTAKTFTALDWAASVATERVQRPCRCVGNRTRNEDIRRMASHSAAVGEPD